MSDRWFYRIHGQDFGPVSLELVRTLVASGAIAPDDEVRDADRSNWILACAASELKPSLAVRHPKLRERRSVRDEWFCRGASGDFGPLTLSDLIQLAADGALKADEEIKITANDGWKRLSSIQRLVELLPFPNSDHRPVSLTPFLLQNHLAEKKMEGLKENDLLSPTGDEVLEQATFFLRTESRKVMKETMTSPAIDSIEQLQFDILPFPGTNSFVPRSDSAGHEFHAASTAAYDTGDEFRDDRTIGTWGRLESMMHGSNSLWTGWTAGTEFGPVDFAELLNWAVTGRLSPMDFVRRGDEGPYVPAVDVPCLFTVRAAANSLSRPVALSENSKLAPTVNLEHPLAQVPRVVASLPAANEAALFNGMTSTKLLSEIKHLVNDPRAIGISALLVVGFALVSWVTRR